MNRKALVVCNGRIRNYEFYSEYFKTSDFIVCADGGAFHMIKFGLKPDVLIGDFDSVSKEHLEYFKEEGVEVLKYPSEKDMTDAELALETACKRNYREIIIIGGTGTRLDHSLANIFTLVKLLKRGIKSKIVDEHNEITVIDDKIELKKRKNTKVSLLALTENVKGITSEGLYYRLNNTTLEFDSPYAISNEFIQDTAKISIKDGLLAVVLSKD